MGWIKNLGLWTLNHFFLTFFMLYIVTTVLFAINLPIAALTFGFILVVYIILFLVLRIGLNIKKLLHHEIKFRELIITYISSIFFTILLFSMIYAALPFTNAGYLRYGDCIDKTHITKESMQGDANFVDNIFHYPYYATMTFFTVGYGDICPMGIAKLVASINALIGNLFTVVIVALAITNYSSRDRENL